MKVSRFTGRTSREALAAVRSAFGDEAVVLSTKPSAEGVEVLAMASDGLQHIETLSQTAPKAQAAAPAKALPNAAPAKASANAAPGRAMAAAPAATRGATAAQLAASRANLGHGVGEDVEQLAMSTLSFQDYVRERMLKRRQAALDSERHVEPAFQDTLPPQAATAAMAERATPAQARPTPAATNRPAAATQRPAPLELRDEILVRNDVHSLADAPYHPQQRREQQDMMNELRSMKGLIEERFGALAFMEKLQRQPAQARLAQKLLDAGFSPALIRKLAHAAPNDCSDESAWAASVLERNLTTGEHEPAIEDQGGVFALIGSTGVGKTTSTAKIAAAFATKHGAANLGLITLDAYRVAAHEQLRAYGRILGVPVHTAHDRATLEDLLDLLSAKKMVLIDTAGIGQRDARTRELLECLSHRAIKKLLVINAAAQGETIEDVMLAYRANTCSGVVLSKLDEAVKLGPALDALIRHRQKVVGVANGQRVPEDWHRLSSQALLHRALRANGGNAWRLDTDDVNLVFAMAPQSAATNPALAV